MLLVLNLVHILSGVFWAGSVLLLTFFVVPAIEASGAQGKAVMQSLLKGTRFPLAMMLSGMLTVLSGLAMYWLVSDGLKGNWIGSAHGIAITVGGLGGVLAAIVGGAISGRATKRLGAVMQQIEAAGKPATAEQEAEIRALQTTMRMGTVLGTLFILVALVGMAVARAV